MNKLFIVVLLMLFNSACNKNSVKRLSLVQAYEVITHGKIEPSGLTWWDGEFFTVSDKDNIIYKLIFSDNSIELKPVITIKVKQDVKLDFEGITHDEDFFYLISETHFQILKISKNGKNQEWIPRSNMLKAVGQKAGLFVTNNAFFEGICILEEGNFLLAAERQPRGFVTFDAVNNTANAYQANTSSYTYKDKRSPDFTGLSCDDGLYVLDRNAYVVAELNNVKGQFTQGRGYSYEHIIDQDKLIYKDMTFGQAEGLVVKGDMVYIILDNNRGFRQNKESNNSLFLIMKK